MDWLPSGAITCVSYSNWSHPGHLTFMVRTSRHRVVGQARCRSWLVRFAREIQVALDETLVDKLLSVDNFKAGLT